MDATENELSLLPPPRAWKSCGLKDLRLNGNRLTHLDLDKCDKFWPQLESLYVGQNNLKEVSTHDILTCGCEAVFFFFFFFFAHDAILSHVQRGCEAKARQEKKSCAELDLVPALLTLECMHYVMSG